MKKFFDITDVCLVEETIASVKMSPWLLTETDDNEKKDNSKMRVVKSMKALSDKFRSSGMNQTADLLQRSNSILGKQLGLLRTGKKEEIKNFDMLYGATITFLTALDSFMDSVADSIDAQSPKEGSLLDSVLDGGVEKQLDAFVPSRKSELFPKLMRWYRDMEKLGGGVEESVGLNDNLIDEGPIDAIVGAMKSLVGAVNIPKSKKATAKNLMPLFRGDILKAMQDDFSNMTVDQFNKIRNEMSPMVKLALGPSTSPTNPVTTTQVADAQKVSVKDAEVLSNEDVLNKIITALKSTNSPLTSTIEKGLRDISKDPSLASKIDTSIPAGKAAIDVMKVTSDAAKSGQEPSASDIEKIVASTEEKEQKVADTKPEGSQEKKINVKSIVKKEDKESDEDYEKRLSKIVSILNASGTGVTAPVSKQMSSASTIALNSAIRELMKDRFVKENKETENDSLIIERWQRMAGLIKD